LENLGRIPKIKAGFAEIEAIFIAVPFKLHGLIVTTFCDNVNVPWTTPAPPGKLKSLKVTKRLTLGTRWPKPRKF
jgi:hypothetical protein